ncbi:MAG TPA: hypothetical protein VJ044_09120 [Candidatus Hodarchaeales archaeon]|nr:hypothetical protein [Candidatus Hodarchaeales archaeon]
MKPIDWVAIAGGPSKFGCRSRHNLYYIRKIREFGVRAKLIHKGVNKDGHFFLKLLVPKEQVGIGKLVCHSVGVDIKRFVKVDSGSKS